MGLALDKLSDNDDICELDDFQVVVDKKLLEKFGGIDVEFVESQWFGAQFRITPARKGAHAC